MQAMTLNEVVEWGKAIKEAEAREEADKQAAAEEAEIRSKEQFCVRALKSWREWMGPAFDHLLIEGRLADVNLRHWNGTKVILKLRHGLSISAHFIGQDQELLLCYGPDQHYKIGAGAKSEALAKFIFEAFQYEEKQKAREQAEREDRADRAVRRILEGGCDYWDDQRSAQEVYDGARKALEGHPDLIAKIDAALAQWKATEAEQAAAAYAAELHQADVQSKVWLDFTVWKLTYTETAYGDEGQVVEECTDYSLHPEPDSDGWWPVLRNGGKVINTKFPTLVKVEEIPVTHWDDPPVKRVCRHTLIDGAKVICPPLGAVPIPDDDALPTPDASTDLDGSRLGRALKAVRDVAEKHK